MMQSIASIGSKSTPPPPHNRHSHHRNHSRSRNMLAIQKDINPATYYDNLPQSHSPRAFNAHTSSTSTKPAPKSPSASCRNLLPSRTHIHSHSVNSENDNIGIQQPSASLMDIFSYTEQNMVAQQMSISEAYNINNDYNEFNNHNEFILNPNSSWSDLYGNLKTKTQNKSNKKQYKNAKIKNNISNYMAYMCNIDGDGDGDGEYSDHQEGRDTLYIETETDTESNYATETPLPTAFDSVNDIFNLLPNDNNNNNMDEIKEFSKTINNENEIQIENENDDEGKQNHTNN
eukprot:800672_1